MLDTHVLVWWVSGDAALSAKARLAIESELPDGEILVSSISAWELAMLIAKGRLGLSMDLSTWLETIGEIKAVSFVAVDNDIAVRSTELPGDFHKDPADRIIVATTRKFAASLVTADELIRAYPHVKSIW